MLGLIEWLGTTYAFYRISQDSGIWMLDAKILSDTLANLVPERTNK